MASCHTVLVHVSQFAVIVFRRGAAAAGDGGAAAAAPPPPPMPPPPAPPLPKPPPPRRRRRRGGAGACAAGAGAGVAAPDNPWIIHQVAFNIRKPIGCILIMLPIISKHGVHKQKFIVS